MILERLEIQQLPGIRPGFVLGELEPGINLIVGPNASGKSSLIRALRHLVEESASDDPLALSLRARFRTEDGAWIARRSGSLVAWERDGRSSDPPALPDARFLHCYWLGVEDLLTGHEGDEAIVARLRRELTGGYDLDTLLRRDGPFRVGARHGATEARALDERRQKVREIEGRYEELRREAEALPDLERRIEAGRTIPERRERVDRALELLEARRDRIAREAALEQFPAGPEEMERLRGDERDDLERLDERCEELDNESRTAETQRAEAAARLEEIGLPEELPEPHVLEGRRAALQTARERLRDRAAVRESLEEAEASAQIAAESLGAPEGPPPPLDPESVSRAEALGLKIQEARARVRELEARLEGVPEAPDEGAVDRHRRAVDALRDWLDAGTSDLPKATAATVATVLAAVAAVTLALLGHDVGAAVGGGLAVLGVVGTAVFMARMRAARSGARRRYGETGLEAPEAWTVDGVRGRLEALEDDLAGLKERRARGAAAARDRESLERWTRELEELEDRKEALTAEVGLDPGIPAASLDRFVRLTGQLDDACEARETALLEIGRIDREIRERVDPVRAFLREWGAGPEEEPDGGPDEEKEDGLDEGERAPEAATKEAGEAAAAPDDEAPGLAADSPEARLDRLERALRHFSERCEAAREAHRRIGEADKTLSRIEEDLGRVEAGKEEIFERAGLEADDRDTLTARLEVLDEFRERNEEARDARVREAQLRTRLERDTEILEFVEADDEEALRTLREELEERDEELEGLKESRTELRTRLRQAGTDRKLEEALGELADARVELERARDQALLAAAGRFVVEDVVEFHRTEHEPAVLSAARESFERFTHHEWTLELDDDEGLAARDLVLEERRSLVQLSSGTRMQLLLALRMAWIGSLEEGRETLPIFLDEALTTTDPERFREVAAALAVLADEEGRQILYLCAQPTDTALWRWALGRDPHVVDLADVRFGQVTERGPDDFVVDAPRTVTAPEGEAPEAYAARLGVPPLDPREEPGSIHLFHLLRDDIETLHRFMEEWRITTLGQLEALLEGPDAERLIPEAGARERLARRCRVARLWVEAWRQGRGRPVDRGVLEQSGAISDRFIDEGSELARELDGDPRAILDALPDLPYFRRDKRDQLAEWLEENGFIRPGQPLDCDGRERRVIEEAEGVLEATEVRRFVGWLEAGLHSVLVTG